MKRICLLAVLLVTTAHAEIRPATSADTGSHEARSATARLDIALRACHVRPGLTAQPHIDLVHMASGPARFLAGPFVGSSYMTAHLRVTDADGKELANEAFTARRGAMAGTFTIGITDKHMVRAVGQQMCSYLSSI